MQQLVQVRSNWCIRVSSTFYPESIHKTWLCVWGNFSKVICLDQQTFPAKTLTRSRHQTADQQWSSAMGSCLPDDKHAEHKMGANQQSHHTRFQCWLKVISPMHLEGYCAVDLQLFHAAIVAQNGAHFLVCHDGQGVCGLFDTWLPCSGWVVVLCEPVVSVNKLSLCT